MARAIDLAGHGLYTTDPNPRVGCVIVKDGTVLAEGWHQRAGEAHAEVAALQQLNYKAVDATAYVTLEPCCHVGRTPPCTDALIRSGISRVVIAGLDPNPLVAGQGMEKLSQAGIRVEQGLLAADAARLNPGFIKRMGRQLPYVRGKVAMSLDGRTAMASGESQWITGQAARDDVHLWRARSSAIMTGIGTVLADNPSLNVRLPKAEHGALAQFSDADQPLRAVLDSHLRMPKDAGMLRLPGTTLVYTLPDSAGEQRVAELETAGARVVPLPGDSGTGRIDLETVLRDLAERGVNEVMIEAGAALNGSALSLGLIDELIFYIAPSLMGDQGKGAFSLPDVHSMGQKVVLDILDTRQIGVDWRIIARPKYAAHSK